MDTLRHPTAIGDLVELVVGRLSSEQLHALAARKAAAELRQPDESEQPDFPTELALDARAAVHRVADLRRTVGINEDLIGVYVYKLLVAVGTPEPKARQLVLDETGWRPRTDAERMVAVARDMLSAGYPPDVTRQAIAHAYAVGVDTEEAA